MAAKRKTQQKDVDESYPKRIEEAFWDLYEKLGREPSRTEFREKYPEQYWAIRTRKYRKDITKWWQFLKAIGCDYFDTMMKPEYVDEAIKTLADGLKRQPTFFEFRACFPTAAKMIIQGKYPGVHGWTEYLIKMGFTPRKKHRWTPENIKGKILELYKELGRTPSMSEFGKRYSGATIAISRGAYKKGITSYHDVVADLGLEPPRHKRVWTKEKIEGSFMETFHRLKRIPGSMEFAERHQGALRAISAGRYDPRIKKWSQFVRRMKKKMRMEGIL